MKRAINGVLCGLFLACCVSPSYGRDHIERIVFPKGRCSAVLEGYVLRGGSKHYSIRGNACQEMYIKVLNTTGSVSITITKPIFKFGTKSKYINLKEIKAPYLWRGPLPINGDYEISVSKVDQDTKYKFEIGIEGKTNWELYPNGKLLWQHGEICLSDKYIAWEDGHYSKYRVENKDKETMLIELLPGGNTKFQAYNVQYIYFTKDNNIGVAYYQSAYDINGKKMPLLFGEYSEIKLLSW